MMKKQLLLPVLGILGILMLFSNKSDAQTPFVEVLQAWDSSGVYCELPARVGFNLYGYTGGYQINDTITFNVNFGDGSDTTFIMLLDSVTGGPAPFSFWQSFSHSYTVAGQYSIQYVGIGPDGYSDTLIRYNQLIVSDTCGNVSGTVFLDDNANCIQDGVEQGVPGVWLQLLQGGTAIQWAYTDALGNYYFTAPTVGSYDIQISPPYGWTNATTVCPGTTIAIAAAPSSGNNFGLHCLTGFDLTGTLTGWGYRAGFTSGIYMNVKNLRCVPTSGTAIVVLDPFLTFLTSYPAPDNISGDTLFYNFTNLNNFNQLTSNIYVTTSLSAVLGQSICVDLYVEPLTGDAVPSNNDVTFCRLVRNAIDPNIKEVSPQGVGAAGNIEANKQLTYTIHFQNTGNDVAYNVFLLDTLDGDLDPSSINILSHSHAMDVNMLPGNVLKFTFNNIMLPDSNANEPESHGYVQFTIDQDPNLAIGTQITNFAGIYFDFNDAIITNEVLNTIADFTAGISVSNARQGMAVFPNPTNSNAMVRINLDHADQVTVSVMDLTGKVISQQAANMNVGSNQVMLDLNGLTDGIYMVSVMSANGEFRATQKIVKTQ